MADTFSYHNFSWKGDPRWANASNWTIRAPAVVLVLFFLSVAEVAFGSTWLVQMNHITVPKIIQTLLIPGLSFFNTLPSLHAHLLIRRNPPKLAIWFSSSFVIMMLLSPVLMLASCINSPSAGPALRQAECYAGTPGTGGDSGVAKSIWALMVASSLLSALGYAVHLAMAIKVYRVEKWKKDQGVVEPVDPDEEERRKARARELWVQMTNREGL